MGGTREHSGATKIAGYADIGLRAMHPLGLTASGTGRQPLGVRRVDSPHAEVIAKGRICSDIYALQITGGPDVRKHSK
jgi:hypothetical protein